MIRLAISDYESTEQAHELNQILKGESPRFSIATIGNEIKIELNKENDPSIDLFTVNRSRIPNGEASYTFQLDQINVNNIEKGINDLPIQLKYFWQFTKERINKYRGTTLYYLYLYLKEIEFRYNNKDKILYNEIVSKIAKFKGWS